MVWLAALSAEIRQAGKCAPSDKGGVNNSSNKFRQTITQGAGIPVSTTNTFANETLWSFKIRTSLLPQGSSFTVTAEGASVPFFYRAVDSQYPNWSSTNSTIPGKLNWNGATITTIELRMGANTANGVGSMTSSNLNPTLRLQLTSAGGGAPTTFQITTNNFRMIDNNSVAYYGNPESAGSQSINKIKWDQTFGAGNIGGLGSTFGRTFELVDITGANEIDIT